MTFRVGFQPEGHEPIAYRGGRFTTAPTRRSEHRHVASGTGPAMLVIGLLLVAAVTHAWGMTRSPVRIDDEGTYVAQAWAVQHWRVLAHYTYWYDHPPLGWIQMVLWTWPTRAFERVPYAVAAGRETALVAKLVSCWLLYVLARRLAFGRGAAAAAVLLLSLSPLALNFQRMALLDNLAIPWLLGAFVLAASPGGRLSAFAMSGVCFGAAMLTKETTLILLPALVWLLWRTSDPATRGFALMLFMALVVSAGGLYILYAALKNELLEGPGHVSLLWAVKWQLFSRPSSGSVLDPASPARAVVQTWTNLDPWLLGAAVFLTPAGLVIRRLRPVTLAFAIQVAMLLRDGYLPYPYVIAMLPFGALLVAGVGDALWARGMAGTKLAWRVPVVAGVSVFLLLAGPAWADGVHQQLTVNRDAAMQAASRWIDRHVGRDQRVVVDDSLWVDLVEMGFDPRRREVIWFYKLDLDPAVRVPGGWRGIDYLVLGQVSREALANSRTLRAALSHSRVVAAFGQGSDAVTVREVLGRRRPRAPVGPAADSPSTRPRPNPGLQHTSSTRPAPVSGDAR
jgi:hypothetical protein